MALNLHKAGHVLRAFDLSSAACDALRAQGLRIVGSAAEAVAGAEVVISMLPASQHVEALYLGNTRLLENIAPGALVIDSSTIAAATSRRLAQAGAVRGIGVLDAPVSGGTAGAVAGTLTFMVGGS